MEGASSDHFNLPLFNHEDHGSTYHAAAENNTSDVRHQPSSLAQWSDQKRMIEGEGLQSDYQRGYQAVGTLKSGQGDAGASLYHHAGDATYRAREWVAFQTFLLAQKSGNETSENVYPSSMINWHKWSLRQPTYPTTDYSVMLYTGNH